MRKRVFAEPLTFINTSLFDNLVSDTQRMKFLFGGLYSSGETFKYTAVDPYWFDNVTIITAQVQGTFQGLGLIERCDALFQSPRDSVIIRVTGEVDERFLEAVVRAHQKLDTSRVEDFRMIVVAAIADSVSKDFNIVTEIYTDADKLEYTSIDYKMFLPSYKNLRHLTGIRDNAELFFREDISEDSIKEKWEDLISNENI